MLRVLLLICGHKNSSKWFSAVCIYTYVFAGPVTIGFDEANIIVSEDGGNIEVAVSLLQPVAAPVSVDFDYILETAGFDGG